MQASANPVISYARANEQPQLAAFCAAHNIPEAIFNGCMSHDEIARIRTREQLFDPYLLDLSADETLKLLHAFAQQELTFDEVLEMFQFINESAHKNFIDVFKNSFINVTDTSYCVILAIIDSPAGQRRLLEVLKENDKLDFIHQEGVNTVLTYICYPFKPEFREKYLNQKVETNVVNSEKSYLSYLSLSLPACYQVDHITVKFKLPDLRRYTTHLSDILEQLSKIGQSERFDYLEKVVGLERLAEKLTERSAMIEVFLETIARKNRLNFLKDVIGFERLRTLYETNSRYEGFGEMLIPEHQNEFYEAMLGKEEKDARAEVMRIKDEISTGSFPVGVRGCGWGGKEITLDNGDKKKVPDFMEDHWRLIKSAEMRLITNVEALTQIQEQAKTIAIPPSFLTSTYYTRQQPSIDYATRIVSNIKEQPRVENKLVMG